MGCSRSEWKGRMVEEVMLDGGLIDAEVDIWSMEEIRYEVCNIK